MISLALILPQAVKPAAAASERAIYLYYTHTKETARIVFKRNGQYVQSGLNELNYLLRDWRRDEPTKMDPRLFDLVWEVYQAVGATQPINVVSAYRSPKTNAMLRTKSSGVAENSQHIKGHAMDFFIPGIPLARLRATAMKKQVGGVGFYPTSGNPFVHLDTGSVRAWPRMTRAQLQDLFPDGKTVHVPTDGKPLSQQGYQTAMAGWKTCHAYPCNGSISGTKVVDGGSGRTLVGMLFGGNDNQSGQTKRAAVQMASLAPQPAVPVTAPIPATRPADLGGAALAAAPASPFSTAGSAPLDDAEITTQLIPPLPMRKSEALQMARAATLPSGDAVTAIAALAAPIPQLRLIVSQPEQPVMMTAYLPPLPQEPEAQRALEMIIQRESASIITTSIPTTSLPSLPQLGGVTSLHTASLGGGNVVTGALADLFRVTFGAARQDEPVSRALASQIAKRPTISTMRYPELIAPDLEHVAEVFVTPIAISSGHFAEIWDHDEADFSPATEMGPYVTVLRIGDFPEGLSYTNFVGVQPVALTIN
ncbi:MAG: DUF882 domain-containing protein [Candidatus Devosia symbiotica]|nr:DUF882 domain-containing protein [Candidatus Devosia symbiotica]